MRDEDEDEGGWRNKQGMHIHILSHPSILTRGGWKTLGKVIPFF